MVTRKTERRAWTALAAAWALAGCDGEAPPDDAPALRDVPPDVSEDVPLDAPDAGPPVLELGPGSVAACPPWDAVADPTPRGLPADPTPRLLWVWTPSLDPAVVDRGAPGLSPDAVSRSPDGRLFVTLGGPTRRLAWLSADGELLGVHGHPIGGASGFVSRPLAFPDGGVGVAVNDGGGIGAFLTPTDEGGLNVVAGGSAPIPGVSPGSEIEASVGSGGLVYFLGEDWLAASCHGRERVWLLHFPVGLFDLRVDAEGIAWVRSWDGWAPVSREGEVGAWQSDGRCEDFVADTAYCSERLEADRSVFTSLRGGAPLWTHEVRTTYWSALWDARGFLWIEDATSVRDGRRTLRRIGSEGVVFEVPGQILGHRAFAPLSDGSFIGENTYESTDIGVRDPSTGEERWRLGVPDPTSTGVITGVREMPAVGPDGVAYFAGGISVYAFQLDRLPPEEPYCLGAYCGNSRLDGAARRFTE